MKRNRDIEKQVRQLLYSYKFSGFRRWTVTALAAVVVFCAVYNLILPAAAITGRIARETPGIELGTESGSEGLDAVRTDEMETLSESAEEQSETTEGAQTETTESPVSDSTQTETAETPAAENTQIENTESEAGERIGQRGSSYGGRDFRPDGRGWRSAGRHIRTAGNNERFR